MIVTGLHLLLSYRCTYECDHCFAWGSPFQEGTMTLSEIEEILRQGDELGSVTSIYFEGGEPFLYYAVLLRAVRLAAAKGLSVGIVTNGYWATGYDDAIECLRPFVGLVDTLEVSSDGYHGGDNEAEQARNAVAAAEELGISAGMISVAQPEETESAKSPFGQLPLGHCAVMYRGRAAVELVPRAKRYPWNDFNECPHEDLRDPGRVHIDPGGHVHICQGIAIGNLFETSLRQICADYAPESHPIIGPITSAGPAELVRRYELELDGDFADACHLCDAARRALRPRFPAILAPDQMYGAGNESSG
jgi:MoaA/NifB/PqqE/SkfB family radical SAM enzyme